MRIGLVQHLQELLLLIETCPYAQDERVREQFLRSGSFSGIFLQASCQEVPEVLRASRDGFGRLAGDHDHCDDGLHPQVPWLALTQLHQDDAKRPDVHALSVFLLSNQLGSHPRRRSCELTRSGPFLGELEGIAEVSYLNFPVAVDEDVVALQVPMQLATAVDSIQSPQYLPEDVGDDWLRNGPFELGDEVVERPIVHVLNKHEKCVLHIGGCTWQQQEKWYCTMFLLWQTVITAISSFSFYRNFPLQILIMRTAQSWDSSCCEQTRYTLHILPLPIYQRKRYSKAGWPLRKTTFYSRALNSLVESSSRQNLLSYISLPQLVMTSSTEPTSANYEMLDSKSPLLATSTMLSLPDYALLLAYRRLILDSITLPRSRLLWESSTLILLVRLLLASPLCLSPLRAISIMRLLLPRLLFPPKYQTASWTSFSFSCSLDRATCILSRGTSSARWRLRAMKSTTSRGSSNCGRSSSGRSRVEMVLLRSMSKGRLNLSAHSCGTPSRRPVCGFLRILMPCWQRVTCSRMLISLCCSEEAEEEEYLLLLRRNSAT